MELEIKAIIEKNLPAQVGEVLKLRLDKAEQDVDSLKRLGDSYEHKLVEIESLKKTIETYKAFDNRNATLEAREKAVADGERNLKIATLEFQLNSEKEKTQFSKDVALGLVRNTSYRKNIFDSEFQPSYQDSNGVWHYPPNTNKTYNEDKTAG